MRGDKIILGPESEASAALIREHIAPLLHDAPVIVAIAGESGAGKSSTAHSLKSLLSGEGLEVVLLSQDDYFWLPPASNHARRQETLDFVGPKEVDLELLDVHATALAAGEAVNARLVDWDRNAVESVSIAAAKRDVVIVEGTYVSLLNSPHFKVLITRTFRDTWDSRARRGREPMTEFKETVLEIEHEIIASHARYADLTID